MALFGGALILAYSFIRKDNTSSKLNLNKNISESLFIIGCLLLVAFFIVCGYAHFKFAAFVDTLIPNYIPFHSFWTYFCGVCLFAGGIGMLIPQTRKWSAFLSGIMVFGWFILLHIPRVVASPTDAGERMGLFESFSFAGIFFVLAGIFSDKE